jgi:integrase
VALRCPRQPDEVRFQVEDFTYDLVQDPGSITLINDIRWWHNKTCREAKIEDFWFHDFRHTCITNWRRRGLDFITIMKATGHKMLSMFHRYNAVGDDDLRALVGKTKIDSQNLVNSAT